MSFDLLEVGDLATWYWFFAAPSETFALSFQVVEETIVGLQLVVWLRFTPFLRTRHAKSKPWVIIWMLWWWSPRVVLIWVITWNQIDWKSWGGAISLGDWQKGLVYVASPRSLTRLIRPVTPWWSHMSTLILLLLLLDLLHLHHHCN